MCSCEYQLLRIVQHCFFHLGRSSPEKIYDRAVLIIQGLDNRIGKLFPADSSVGKCLMGANGQYCVQKKYALFCPFFQAAVVRNLAAQVAVEFFINVYQRRGNVYIFSYREAKAVGLSIVMIGILTQNNYFYIV